ncbi:Protein YSC84 AltName: Full=LAS seventeen-binding protein 4; Short=LAS17-binding protein 4 [Serendipita indica DSM 11827]|nr:Protein YSC84 AltName: Full=LAS seventeen-binding protein 4; Short=LAS17-binding protein 4 [Serendipita indica DSM 11827]
MSFKVNTPVPQPLPKECIKATKIFQSFVGDGRGGLDGVVPRRVLEQAYGFAFLSVVKASQWRNVHAAILEGGSGLVIARLDDDTWSAPSAIGTAGMGFGGQAGAEVTDFLFVLNSRSAVRSFMSAGSVTLGGNLSVALGPVGRTGEAAGALNTSGKVAAIYTYARSKGIFGGVSIEGSIIVERQDANFLAYESSVTAQMLLSGVVPVPRWADLLIQTIEQFTGQSGGRRFVRDSNPGTPGEYAFGGLGSPGSVLKKKSTPKSEFPPRSWGAPKENGSYFDSWDSEQSRGGTQSNETEGSLIDMSIPGQSNGFNKSSPFSHMTSPFDTTNADIRLSTDKMVSPFDTSVLKRSNSGPTRPKAVRTESETSLKMKSRAAQLSSQLEGDMTSLSRLSLLRGAITPTRQAPPTANLIDIQDDEVHVDLDKTNVVLPSSSTPTYIKPAVLRKNSRKNDTDSEEDYVPKHKRAPSQRFKAALKEPMPDEGVGRAIVRFDFEAVEVEDLTIRKGDIITILEKSNSMNDWWKGKIGTRVGQFPANFVEVVGDVRTEPDPFDL